MILDLDQAHHVRIDPLQRRDNPGPLPAAVERALDTALAISPEARQLVALTVSDLHTEQGSEHGLQYSSRQVAARESVPEWNGNAETVVDVSTLPTRLPSPTSRPTIDLAAPPLGDGAMGVGLLTILILSIGGLVLVALTVAGVTIARGRSQHQCRA